MQKYQFRLNKLKSYNQEQAYLNYRHNRSGLFDPQYGGNTIHRNVGIY